MDLEFISRSLFKSYPQDKGKFVDKMTLIVNNIDFSVDNYNYCVDIPLESVNIPLNRANATFQSFFMFF